MSALLIGYARCSTDRQDLAAQRDGLAALGVAVNRVDVDHELTGTHRRGRFAVRRWPRAAKAIRGWSPSTTG
jgi:DNA invertase Pin-like site-specific DNA recombinase